MTDEAMQPDNGHHHLFLGAGHDANERRTWAVIGLCIAMMFAEIVGGLVFGSIALISDGLHMSTHAGALLLAALAYRFARRHAHDPRFSFGTGKFGDLAGFASALILAMIALLIGYEAVVRLAHPVAIHFGQAIPIACVGLAVNIASVWLLGGGGHDHAHGHSHGHHAHGDGAHHDHEEESKRIELGRGAVVLSIFETGVPPRFRLAFEDTDPSDATISTVRPDGTRQSFAMARRGGVLESVDEVPEPHAFEARVRVGDATDEYSVTFTEPVHAPDAHRDNNMRAAVVHVIADAAVSVLVIAGLTMARLFGWLWMDPLAGIVGAGVIASWSYGLLRDTGGILLDMLPDAALVGEMRRLIEADGDRVVDLHLWRLGPGHLGVILVVVSRTGRSADDYRARIARFRAVSHVTIEVRAA